MICPRCALLKPNSSFIQNITHSGTQQYCKDCRSGYERKWNAIKDEWRRPLGSRAAEASPAYRSESTGGVFQAGRFRRLYELGPEAAQKWIDENEPIAKALAKKNKPMSQTRDYRQQIADFYAKVPGSSLKGVPPNRIAEFNRRANGGASASFSPTATVERYAIALYQSGLSDGDVKKLVLAKYPGTRPERLSEAKNFATLTGTVPQIAFTGSNAPVSVRSYWIAQDLRYRMTMLDPDFIAEQQKNKRPEIGRITGGNPVSYKTTSPDPSAHRAYIPEDILFAKRKDQGFRCSITGWHETDWVQDKQHRGPIRQVGKLTVEHTIAGDITADDTITMACGFVNSKKGKKVIILEDVRRIVLNAYEIVEPPVDLLAVHAKYNVTEYKIKA